MAKRLKLKWKKRDAHSYTPSLYPPAPSLLSLTRPPLLPPSALIYTQSLIPRFYLTSNTKYFNSRINHTTPHYDRVGTPVTIFPFPPSRRGTVNIHTDIYAYSTKRTHAPFEQENIYPEAGHAITKKNRVSRDIDLRNQSRL